MIRRDFLRLATLAVLLPDKIPLITQSNIGKIKDVGLWQFAAQAIMDGQENLRLYRGWLETDQGYIQLPVPSCVVHQVSDTLLLQIFFGHLQVTKALEVRQLVIQNISRMRYRRCFACGHPFSVVNGDIIKCDWSLTG